MGECIIAHRSVVKNEYQKLADIIVSGSAVTQVDISGLNIGKGDELVLVSTIINGTATGLSLEIYFNNNTTSTNYYTQELLATNVSVSAGRFNSSRLAYVYASSKAHSQAKIKLTNNGYGVIQSSSDRAIATTDPIMINPHYLTTTFTVTNITQLTLKSSIANGIGIGSRFTLYRIGGA